MCMKILGKVYPERKGDCLGVRVHGLPVGECEKIKDDGGSVEHLCAIWHFLVSFRT